jgi:hypothetical protein
MNACDEILHAIAAAGFAPKDFFLTQPPAPDKKDKAAYARWYVRERRRWSIAQRMYRYGLTAHDLALIAPELPAASGADGGVTQARRMNGE